MQTKVACSGLRGLLSKTGNERKMALSTLSDATFEAAKRHFLEWCRQNNRTKFSLLITGKPGVGKSSLVNALFGKQVAEESHDNFRLTDKATSYDVDIEGVKFLVWDSPGLGDDDDDDHKDGTGNDEKYLAEIQSKITEKLDLVILCLKMDDRRFHRDDKETFKILTTKFGKEMWKNTVIALTFANKVDHPAVVDKKAFFLQDLERWREEINSFLSKELELDSKLLQSLSLVPTGYYRPVSVLPSGGNWLSKFWIACYCIARNSAAFSLYQINSALIRIPESENLAAACAAPTVVPTSPSAD